MPRADEHRDETLEQGFLDDSTAHAYELETSSGPVRAEWGVGQAGPPCDPLAPTVGQWLLERYELHEESPAGPMGAVWHARDHVLRRDVTLRLLPPSILEHTEAQQRLQRGAQALMPLAHPHILQLHRCHLEGTAPFLEFAHTSGRTLQSELETRGPLPERDVRQWLLQLCAALHVAHRQGIVHAALTPRAVMLSEDGTVTLAFIRMLGDDAFDLPGADASRVPAPEPTAGEVTDITHDLVALGALAYELLAGRTPFVGGPAEHAATSPRSLATIAPVLWPVVKKLLGSNRGRRFANMRVVGDAVRTAPAARRRRRRRRWAAVILLPLLLFMGSTGVGLARNPGRRAMWLYAARTRALNSTPLHIAASLGYTPVVRWLIEHGADIDGQNAGGFTPLSLAAIGNHYGSVALFLDLGADPTLGEKQFGSTPLHHVAGQGDADMIALMVAKGVDPDLRLRGGLTPLHLAARKGRRAVVQILLAQGADPRLQNDQGQTPRDLALEEGHNAVAAVLHEYTPAENP